ncbi:MAG: patatin-like phospholipase family protein [Candidatus Eisenbacteria bacterium]
MRFELRRLRRTWWARGTIGLALVLGLLMPAGAKGAELPRPREARPRIGLALSGGGARALAEIGVLRAFEEAGVPIDCIAGNSMGALLGGLYAAGIDSDSLRVLAHSPNLFRPATGYANQSVFQKQLVRPQAFGLYFDGWEYRLPQSLLSDSNLNWMIVSHTAAASLAAGGDFDRLPIPFRAVALDLRSGELNVFRSGDLARAIRSSISVPVTFPPIRMHQPERILVDAGPRANLPIDLLSEMGAERVIAVNCTQGMNDQRSIEDVSEVALRLVRILSTPVDSSAVDGWDVWIEPKTPGVGMNEYDRADEMIEAGYQAARAKLPEVLRLLEYEPSLASNLSNQRDRAGAAEEGAEPARVAQRTSNDRDARPALAPLRVAYIRLEGRRLSYSWVPRSELGIRAGDRFDLAKLGRGVRRLYGTNLYDSVWPRLEPVGNDQVGIVLELEERRPTFVSVGLLYDNSRLVNTNLEWTYSNLLRLGETWYVDLALGNHRDGGELGVRSGRMRGVPLAFDLVAKTNRTTYRLRDGGELRRKIRGVQLSTGALGIRQAMLLAGARVLRDEGEPVGSASLGDLGLGRGWSATDRSLFATLWVDGTDQRVLPTRGLRARADYEIFFSPNLKVRHLSYSGCASLSVPIRALSLTGEAALGGVSREDLPFRSDHRVDLTRATLGRMERASFAPFTGMAGATVGYRLASNLSLFTSGRAGLWSRSFDDLKLESARRGLESGLLQRTPIGPISLGVAMEEERGPFYFIQVGHDLLPER